MLTAVRRAHENVSFWERHARESVALTCLLDNQDGIPALAPLRPAIMHELASCMSRQSCAEGEVVVSQGDRAEPQYFYIVQSGAFQASSVDGASAERKVLATYGAGGYFGELALLRSTPRAATVACTAAGEVWRLGRAAFRRGVIGRSLREAAEKIAFLRPLAPEVLDQIVDAMFEVPCTVGEVVIRQGDPGGNLYLVEDDSELEHKLLEMIKDIQGSFPMLEFEPGSLMCDSLAIVALLVRSSGSEQLLGSNLQEQNDQIEWMRYIRETCYPCIQSLKLMAFGNYNPTQEEYWAIMEDYKK